jgi:DNA-binding NarL/FixJ family response regulator
MITIFVVDDHPAFRLGLVAMLEETGEFQCVGQADTMEEAVEGYPEAKPQVVILDLRLPDQSGIHLARALLALDPECKIVILTASDNDEDLYQAYQLGVLGYLPKYCGADQVAEVVRKASQGINSIEEKYHVRIERRSVIPDLTVREMQVLTCIADGLSNKEAASELQVSAETVKAHLKTLFIKLNAADRTQAVLNALRIGLLKRP